MDSMIKPIKHKLRPLSDRTIGSINWVGLWTLYSKEVERFLKVYQQTIAGPALTTLLFLAVFSLALGRAVLDVGGIKYIEFLAPGLIIMTMAQNAFTNTSSSLISSKIMGNIVDLLMPPFTAHEINIAFIFGAITRAFLVGVATALLMFPFVNIMVSNVFYFIFFFVSGSIMMSLIGLISGIWAEKFDHIGAITNFAITPLTFLSGTFYSINRLPEPFYTISQFNPFFYMIDGFRYSMIGYADANVYVGMIVLSSVNIFLYFISWIMLTRGWYLKP